MREVEATRLAGMIDKLHEQHDPSNGPEPPSVWCTACGRRHRAAMHRDGTTLMVVWVCSEDGSIQNRSAEELVHKDKLIVPPSVRGKLE